MKRRDSLAGTRMAILIGAIQQESKEIRSVKGGPSNQSGNIDQRPREGAPDQLFK